MAKERKKISFADRMRAINRILRKKESVSGVANDTGVHRDTLHRWLKIYKDQGEEGVRAINNSSGRPPGTTKKITENSLLSTLCQDSNSSFESLQDAPIRRAAKEGLFFWTAEMVAEHYKREENIDVTETWVRKMLGGLGIFPLNSPIALLRKESWAKAWFENEFYRFQARARKEQAGIVSLLKKTDTFGTLWAVVGMKAPTKFRLDRFIGQTSLLDILNMLDDESKQHRAPWAWEKGKMFILIPSRPDGEEFINKHKLFKRIEVLPYPSPPSPPSPSLKDKLKKKSKPSLP